MSFSTQWFRILLFIQVVCFFSANEASQRTVDNEKSLFCQGGECSGELSSLLPDHKSKIEDTIKKLDSIFGDYAKISFTLANTYDSTKQQMIFPYNDMTLKLDTKDFNLIRPILVHEYGHAIYVNNVKVRFKSATIEGEESEGELLSLYDISKKGFVLADEINNDIKLLNELSKEQMLHHSRIGELDKEIDHISNKVNNSGSEKIKTNLDKLESLNELRSDLAKKFYELSSRVSQLKLKVRLLKKDFQTFKDLTLTTFFRSYTETFSDLLSALIENDPKAMSNVLDTYSWKSNKEIRDFSKDPLKFSDWNPESHLNYSLFEPTRRIIWPLLKKSDQHDYSILVNGNFRSLSVKEIALAFIIATSREIQKYLDSKSIPVLYSQKTIVELNQSLSRSFVEVLRNYPEELAKYKSHH